MKKYMYEMTEPDRQLGMVLIEHCLANTTTYILDTHDEK